MNLYLNLSPPTLFEEREKERQNKALTFDEERERERGLSYSYKDVMSGRELYIETMLVGESESGFQ